jgi:hypothetical protein
VREANDLTTFMCRMSWKSGSLNPLGHTGPVTGILYLYFTLHTCQILTFNLLTTTIVAPPSNARKWQMGFNLAFKGLMKLEFCQQCFEKY